MPSDVLPISGSLDLDTAIDLIKPGDVIESLNTSSLSGFTNLSRVRTTVPGNQSFPLGSYSLPAGTNMSLGSFADPIRNRVIDFLYNSGGNHQIREWDFSKKVVNVLVADGTAQTGGQFILGFDKNSPITSISILHRNQTTEGDLLFWTDGINDPRELNIDLARGGAGAYGALTANDLLQGKVPPYFCATAGYVNDTTYSANNLKSKLFQFAYRYIYDDYSKSTYSPWSKVPIPNGSTDPFNDYTVTNNNRINVTVLTGSHLVTGIEIIGRIGTGNRGGWTDPFLITTVLPAQFGSGGTYQLIFYNDGSYSPVDIPESLLLFSAVPQLADAMTFANGNVLVYGAITEGYNFSDVTLNVTMNTTTDPYSGSSSPNIVLQASDFSTAAVQTSNTAVNFTVNYVGATAIVGAATVSVFASVHVHLGFPTFGTTYYNYYLNFTLTNAQPSQTINEDTGHQIANDVAPSMQITGVTGTRQNPSAAFFSTPKYDWYCQYGFGLVYFDKLGRTNTVYTNAAMKLFMPGYNYNTSNQTTLMPAVQANIYHKPPSWAVSYQWVRTRNLTEDYFLYWMFLGFQSDAKFYYFDVSNIPYNFQSVNPSTNFAYDFVPGDRMKLFNFVNIFGGEIVSLGEVSILGLVINPKAGNGDFVTGAQVTNGGFGYTSAPSVLLSGGGGSGATGIATISNGQVSTITITNPGTGYTSAPTISLSGGGGSGAVAIAISGYYPGTFIKTANNGQYSTISGKQLIKIYRPAQNVGDASKIYYEFGECYPIINPGTANAFHGGMLQNQTINQPAVFKFTEGDVYFSGIQIPSSVYQIPTPFYPTLAAMTANYDDNFPSAQNANGRTESVFITAKQLKYPALVRFSESYIPDTRVNRLNLFFDQNQDEYSIDYGSIRRFSNRGQFIRVFQQLKTGNVPVLQNVIQTATGNDVLAQSERILNKIQYDHSEYGIGDAATSLASSESADYFCDTNNGVQVRVAHNGITPISKLYGANSLFGKNLPGYSAAVMAATTADPATPNAPAPLIQGFYDEFKSEYVVMMQAIDRWQNGSQLINQAAVTIGFAEGKNGYESNYSYVGDNGGHLNNLIYTFFQGLLYTHDNAKQSFFYGVQYDSYVTPVINPALVSDKTYVSVKEIANTIWYADVINTALAQTSKIPAVSFKLLEGNASASFFRDINSSGGLINGTTLKGKWLTIRFRLTPASTPLSISAAVIRYNVYP